MSAKHDDRFMIALWRAASGRVIKRTTYKTLRGAHEGAARESTDSFISRVTVHAPVGDDGHRTDLATFVDGRMVGPLVTKQNAKTPRVQRMVEHFMEHTEYHKPNRGGPIMAKDDPGTEVQKPKPDAKAKAAAPPLKRKNPVGLDELLGLTDAAIQNLPVERRPEFPAEAIPALERVAKDFPYALVYARFLSGTRKWYPNPWMSKTSAPDGREVRQKVRSLIGKAAGVKVGNADGTAPRKPKPAPKPARSIPSTPLPKPKPAPAAAARPKPRPKPKATAKASTKRTPSKTTRTRK